MRNTMSKYHPSNHMSLLLSSNVSNHQGASRNLCEPPTPRYGCSCCLNTLCCQCTSKNVCGPFRLKIAKQEIFETKTLSRKKNRKGTAIKVTVQKGNTLRN